MREAYSTVEYKVQNSKGRVVSRHDLRDDARWDYKNRGGAARGYRILKIKKTYVVDNVQVEQIR